MKISIRKANDLFIRDAITGLGTILMEDLEHHYYITSLRIGLLGNALSYAIVHRDDHEVVIAAFAHEGLIRQSLAKKALEKLSVALS